MLRFEVYAHAGGANLLPPLPRARHVSDAPRDARVKAELIAAGSLAVEAGILEGYRLSRSTAGPGAGSSSVAIGWMGEDGREHRVKLSLAADGDEAPVRLVGSPGGDLELRGASGEVLLEGVGLVPVVMHAPGQAFINIDGECVHSCAFCTTHLLDERRRNRRTAERWVELIVAAHNRSPFPAVAVTSVAAPDHEGLLREYEAVIRGVLTQLPDVVVGVEPPVRSNEDIHRLRAAGATEMKINIQSPEADLLERVCPGWDLARQYDLLEEAVGVFGRGRVTTNVLIGLGESDGSVEDAIERLSSTGVVPTLRVVRVNDGNLGPLTRALGHAPEPVGTERHLRLAAVLGGALQRNGLSRDGLRTMCHGCGCCDREPGWDL